MTVGGKQVELEYGTPEPKTTKCKCAENSTARFRKPFAPEMPGLRSKLCQEQKEPFEGWHNAFIRKPPSPICKAHRGSALCRWEMHKQRRKLWRKIAPSFQGRPAAFLTL